MSKVAITKSKLDNLANAIAGVASTPAPLTIDQMTTAVGTLVKPVGTLQITANGEGIDVAQYAAVDVNVSGGGGGTYQTKEHITPTKSSQTAVAAGRYTTGAITVAAIPAAYQDVTQVDATAGDVASGKKIVDSSGTVVTGTLAFSTIYTGSSTPASSLGVNGDIYVKM